MTRFAVIVRDEISEASTTVEIEAASRDDARYEALRQCFRERGWRHCVALDTEEMEGDHGKIR